MRFRPWCPHWQWKHSRLGISSLLFGLRLWVVMYGHCLQQQQQQQRNTDEPNVNTGYFLWQWHKP